MVGNYGQVRDLVWQSADTPGMARSTPAPGDVAPGPPNLRRAVMKEGFWGTGNRESFANAFFSRQSILLWALRTHRRNRGAFGKCAAWRETMPVVRLSSPRESR